MVNELGKLTLAGRIIKKQHRHIAKMYDFGEGFKKYKKAVSLKEKLEKY
jgi:CelD/BcsL family acetyltransferase involved in cellulose biosynthesis